MKLVGSCCCKKIIFECLSNTPYPFMRCYCSICRKTNGSGGFGINIMAKKDDRFKVTSGEEHLKYFQSSSSSQRFFCGECGSHLWNFHPDYPEFIYPYASAIDTDLPDPPQCVHIFVKSKPGWVHVQKASEENDLLYDKYPKPEDSISIESWHKRHGLWKEDK